MSQENVDLLYRWYEAFRQHDNDTCVRNSAAEVVSAEIRMAGRGAGSGLEIEQTTWQVTRFREGKMTGFRAYGNQAEALEAMGLSG